MKYILNYKRQLLGICLVLVYNLVSAQDAEIEIKVVKNALMVRPINLLSGMFGIGYERYIKSGYSALLYMEYDKGAGLSENAYGKWAQTSMGVNDVVIKYEGFSIIPEVRRYFYKEDPDASLIGLKDQGSLVGWFVGAYVPVRHLKTDLTILSNEQYAYAIQQDTGTYHLNSWMYGLGIEGGRHWVWGQFSMEIMLGISYSTGLPGNVDFNFNRPGIGTYTENKNLGLISTYSHWSPRFGINFGIAF